MNSKSRRQFLKTSLAAGLTLGWSARSWAAVSGANNALRVATVGFRGRGRNHLTGLRAIDGVRYVGLCDVDRDVLDQGVDAAKKRKEDVTGYTDIRRLLERRDLDAITIATPNHWHALGAIWAVQAGKDVYVEKPVSHNVWEGRQLVTAARKYGRIVQTGTQTRSSHAVRDAVAWVRAGNFGRIRICRGLCYNKRGSIGRTDGPQPVPATMDYDLWSGPAPLTPPRRKSAKQGTVHYDWHWFWAYGNGDLGNQGIHQMDIARWFLGESRLSPRVMSVGGRFGYVDDAETPNTQIVYHDYPAAPLIFEVRGLTKATGSDQMDKYKDGQVAVIVECEGGDVIVPNYFSAKAIDRNGRTVKEWSGTDDHYANFIKAVRSRKTSDLTADVEEGHLSSALCHTGNISYLLGQRRSPDEIKAVIKSDRDALPTFERMTEHLAANGVDLTKEKLILGPVLKMNPATETFIGNPAAGKLLTREYRAPFVVPAKV